VAAARHGAALPQAFAVRQRFDGATATLDELQDAVSGGADSIELDLSRVDPAAGARVHALAATVTGAGRSCSGLAPVADWDAVPSRLYERRRSRLVLTPMPHGRALGQAAIRRGVAAPPPAAACRDGGVTGCAGRGLVRRG
jgi:hypothetical protein